MLILLVSLEAPKALNTKTPLFTRASFEMPLKAGAVQFDAEIMHPDISAVTVQTCDVRTEDYCITNGHFIFQEPVDPLYADPLAKNYKYASSDNGKRETHRGVDFSAAVYTPVMAAADGEVVFAGMEKSKIHSPWVNYYGNFIVIRHANELYTLYAHLSRIDVQTGQVVQAGEVIGGVGRTGAAIGPHLHFEVRRGANGENFYSTENPELWLVLEKDGNLETYGALSIQFDAGLNRKVQRNLVVEYYPIGSKTPDTVIHTYTYPVGFENNQEDAVLSNLQPGRYRIVVSGSEGVRDRWVYVESSMLTKVYMSPR